LGGVLFERKQSGLQLTPFGQRVATAAARVESEILALGSALHAAQRVLSGKIRFTCSEAMANIVVMPCLREFRSKYPDIIVDLIADDHFLYCSKAYADQHGHPKTAEALDGHLVVGMEGSMGNLPIPLWLSRTTPNSNVAVRSNNLTNVVSALKSGLGVGMLPCLLGDVEPDLLRCLPPIAELDSQTWLGPARGPQAFAARPRFCGFYFGVRPQTARPICRHRSSRMTARLHVTALGYCAGTPQDCAAPICSKALHRQHKNIADAALGLDHARCIRINLQLAPQPQDLNIDAPIEDIFMNSRRMQQMLARKRPLGCFQKRQQQGILAFTQRDWCFIRIYESSTITLKPPTVEPVAAPFRIANLRGTRHLASSQDGAGTCEQFPGTRPYDVVVGAKFEADDGIGFVSAVAGDDDWNICFRPD
jgi:hypothetical protein